MGHRLHTARIYQVEYGNAQGFNNKVEEFHRLLSTCGATYTGYAEDFEFEVSRSDWNLVIERISNLDTLDDSERDKIEKAIKCTNQTAEEIIDIMTRLDRESDQRNDFLFLSFF